MRRLNAGRRGPPRPGQSTIGDGVGLYWRYEKQLRRLESAGRIDARRDGRHLRAAPIVVSPASARHHPRRRADADASGARGLPRRVQRARASPSIARRPTRGAERRRKVRTLAGNFQILWQEPRLLVPIVNPVWLQYVSHKIGRLLVPVRAVRALRRERRRSRRPSSSTRSTLVAQCALYLLGGYGAWLDSKQDGRGRPAATVVVPRSPGVAFTFLVMNYVGRRRPGVGAHPAEGVAMMHRTSASSTSAAERCQPASASSRRALARADQWPTLRHRRGTSSRATGATPGCSPSPPSCSCGRRIRFPILESVPPGRGLRHRRRSRAMVLHRFTTAPAGVPRHTGDRRPDLPSASSILRDRAVLDLAGRRARRVRRLLPEARDGLRADDEHADDAQAPRADDLADSGLLRLHRRSARCSTTRAASTSSRTDGVAGAVSGIFGNPNDLALNMVTFHAGGADGRADAAVFRGPEAGRGRYRRR